MGGYKFVMKFHSLFELDSDDLNSLIEKGECFYVSSTLLPTNPDRRERDAFWNGSDELSEPIREANQR